MPIDDPPGIPGEEGVEVAHEAARLYTSIRNRRRTTGPDETHQLLRRMDLRLTQREDRMEGIKLLRVMLMAGNHRRTRKDLGKMMKKYYRVYRIPRLSEVGAAAGIYEVEEHPQHIDEDWFGSLGGTWWDKVNGADLNGLEYEKEVALKLLNFLERSMHMAESTGDPESWRYHRNRNDLLEDGRADWKADLAKQTPDDREIEPIRFEWKLDSASTALGVEPFTDGDTMVLRLTTPWPVDTHRLQLL